MKKFSFVHVLAVGHVGNSPLALRLTLEYFGFRVWMHYIATAQQFIDALAEVDTGQYVVIDAHGDERGLLLEQLHESVAATQPYVDVITAANLREFLSLPPCTVINLGCLLGAEAFAKAFLAGGCTHYIGATDYPDGNAALYYAQSLFYRLAQDVPLLDAHAMAQATDADTAMFTVYSCS